MSASFEDVVGLLRSCGTHFERGGFQILRRVVLHTGLGRLCHGPVREGRGKS
ncbi:hypothetical protein FP2506_05621 [Fulvimarina pelagi HTCC2506]|uniref:Uncharacterized protein n=1 Tax=Fulvimarina pelagi HTCC2506 TaxID=314231 RepID=Q0G7S2_9HYPH|nr:hypothetical protein FP2506_05621 [Fulvimarina pelagi HTCC2506]